MPRNRRLTEKWGLADWVVDRASVKGGVDVDVIIHRSVVEGKNFRLSRNDSAQCVDRWLTRILGVFLTAVATFRADPTVGLGLRSDGEERCSMLCC